MAEKVKSKTNVAARANQKLAGQNCKHCGNKVEMVMAVSAKGKKRMKRMCCEAA